MRILHIITSPFYIDNKPRYLQLVKYASENSTKVDLVTYPIGRDVKIKNLNIHRAPCPFYQKESPGPSLLKILVDIMVFLCAMSRVITKEYDIVQGEDIEAGFIAIIIGKLFGIKSIYSMINPLKETFIPYDTPEFLNPLFRIIQNVLNSLADAILTNWKHDKVNLDRKYLHKKIIHEPEYTKLIED
ncbi:hypothetical protein AKJ54_01190 [candidate division MSBL1 archaeon SCGC-AAA382K21]|uniref:Glycosyltransferase subfamily 4-like N-terminal domain-containing protein n=1 Tax=candidate division MSBL1 archaeon SCGC-AAA382K21 TaxID=1698283 RepID=A0A133VJR0_9EURY|nr:hypothetical protein AKJ54_01190 [candidate division MSBL1 archaeon SCGC-AAA382K21]